MQENVIPHDFSIGRKERMAIKNHDSFLLWFTGLSGSGKSTIANAVEKALVEKGIHTYTLDGDNVRKGLNTNLKFSPEDRKENIRRIAEVSHLMIDAGLVVLAAFVSPYQKDRENIRDIVGAKNYIEIFVNTPVEECERRGPDTPPRFEVERNAAAKSRGRVRFVAASGKRLCPTIQTTRGPQP